MNETNIKYAIELMKSADRLNMATFQSRADGKFIQQNEHCTNLEDFHRCGNTACFIGYLVLTPLWKDFFTNIYGEKVFFDYDGTVGLKDKDGKLKSEELYAEFSLGDFLGINSELAASLVYGYDYGFDEFYPVKFEKVKPEHVIEKLEQILSGELV